MKKTLAILLTCVFCLGALAVSGCGDPCEKAVDKMIECMGKEEGGEKMAEALKEARKEAVEECKKNKGKMDDIKKCNKESDCKKFLACFMKIAD